MYCPQNIGRAHRYHLTWPRKRRAEDTNSSDYKQLAWVRVRTSNRDSAFSGTLLLKCSLRGNLTNAAEDKLLCLRLEASAFSPSQVSMEHNLMKSTQA